MRGEREPVDELTPSRGPGQLAAEDGHHARIADPVEHGPALGEARPRLQLLAKEHPVEADARVPIAAMKERAVVPVQRDRLETEGPQLTRQALHVPGG